MQGKCSDPRREAARRAKIAARTVTDKTRKRMSDAQSVRRVLEAEERLDGFIDWFDHEMGLDIDDGELIARHKRG